MKNNLKYPVKNISDLVNSYSYIRIPLPIAIPIAIAIGVGLGWFITGTWILW